MYSVLKNKKIWLNKTNQSPVHFCCFLDNRNALLIFENSSFSIIDLTSQSQNKQIYSSILPVNAVVIDCKRISPNTCAIINQKRESLIILEFNSHEIVSTKQIQIPERAFLNQKILTSSIVPFNSNQFVIMEQSFQNKAIHFFIFSIKSNEKLEFTKDVTSVELEWVNTNFQILKALQKSKQFAIYKQKQMPQISWKIKFIPLNKDYDDKIIDLHQFLTEEHSLMDIMVKDANEYYIFVKKCTKNTNKESIQVWRSRLHSNHGNFVQSCELMTNYGFNNIHFIEIISINYDLGFFLSKNFSHQEVEGEIFDNTLQIVHLETGVILQKLHCNLKSFDISPNKQAILDYSQEINHLDEYAVHIRTLLNKKIIYHFLLQNTTVLAKDQLSRSFQAQILQLL